MSWGVLGALAAAGTAVASGAANIGFGVWQNYQNRKLTHEQWERDDNAVQRRVADLRAAGLSPVLAAGSAAGNSGAIPASKIDHGVDPMMFAMLRQADADVSLTREQAKLIRVQAREHGINADLKEQEYEHLGKLNPKIIEDYVSRIRHTNAHSALLRVDRELRESQVDLNKLDVAIREVQRDVAKKFGLDSAETELLIKKAMLDQAREDLEVTRHDFQYWKRERLPTSTRTGLEQRVQGYFERVLRSLGIK